jgi:hypothetical protein
MVHIQKNIRTRRDLSIQHYQVHRKIPSYHPLIQIKLLVNLLINNNFPIIAKIIIPVSINVKLLQTVLIILKMKLLTKLNYKKIKIKLAMIK